ncbi:MAG: DNA-directed RNA polymerase subunit alpha [Parcubacteria group bacterium]|nr:DNA-directed RNA polymerase subunit alpha [Parcubacteria group bacterium]
MESISLPSSVSIELDGKNEFSGTVTIEPLYPGYGPTVANALRRVLLSSLPGAAIFAFKIKGVEHEFKSIEYVKEDVVDISLNLKRVNLKCFSDEPVKLTLSAAGEKVVTAGDITPNSDVEIVNPDQVIMTLTDKAASVEMTLWVRQGRGYAPVESRPEEELEVNAIAIDSIFTPILEVGYQVENIRVGGRTDYDKAIMRITSNGALSIEDALKQSAKILEEHFRTVGEMASGAEKAE